MKTILDTKPTMREYERALKKAGLPVDPTQWTAEIMEKAAKVLDACHHAKLKQILSGGVK